MTPEEIAELRELHVSYEDRWTTRPVCRECLEHSYPCPVVRLLDALAERDAENARLRAVLKDAKGNLLWATGGWGNTSEADLNIARNTMRGFVERIDAALASVKGGEA